VMPRVGGTVERWRRIVTSVIGCAPVRRSCGEFSVTSCAMTLKQPSAGFYLCGGIPASGHSFIIVAHFTTAACDQINGCKQYDCDKYSIVNHCVAFSSTMIVNA